MIVLAVSLCRLQDCSNSNNQIGAVLYGQAMTMGRIGVRGSPYIQHVSLQSFSHFTIG
jgi:hypothetical protein